MLGMSQLMKLALPWMAAQCIDAVQASGHAGLRLAGLWIGAIGLLYLGVWLLHGPARVLERGVALCVRRSSADALYMQLAHAPLAWHDQHHSGDLHHRVAQASGALFGFTQSQFLYMQNAIHLVGPLLALWLLSHVTGALAFAGVVVIATLVLRFDRALTLRQPLFRALQQVGASAPVRAPGLPVGGLSRAVAGPVHTWSPRMNTDMSHNTISDDEIDEPAEAGTDAISVLMADHREVRRLFGDYEVLVADDASDDTRGDLAREICQALSAHASVEEELFYPALREAVGNDDSVDEALADHAVARELIEQLEAMEPSDDQYDNTVRMLQETFDQHVSVEEAELFEQAKESSLDLDSLGDQITQRKDDLLVALEVDEV
jgi:hemerythrin superfamily protein